MGAAREDACARCEELQRRVKELEAENARLRTEAARAVDDESPKVREPTARETRKEEFSPLSRAEMERYSRQMLVPDFRIARQLKLRQSRVLIVGAGGLGCPVALYLGAMGVGTMRLVDNDRVERSNLHRQIGHSECSMGELKVHSLARRVRQLNPDVVVETHATRFSVENSIELVKGHDVVVDASDNPETRYLVNDACVKTSTPLVSGSALGLEGQVTVFTYENDAPCYRCMYPHAPRQPQSCAENGVLGVVPGIIGCIQALEAVKVLSGTGAPSTGYQLLFDAYDSQFRRITVRTARREDCSSCGSSHSFIDQTRVHCTACDEPVYLPPENRLTPDELFQLRQTDSSYVLLDTRAPHQFEMVHFPEAVSVPFDQLRRAYTNRRLVECIRDAGVREASRTLVICRRGVDSATVTSWLLACGLKGIMNVDGGYTAYGSVDKRFPMY